MPTDKEIEAAAIALYEVSARKWGNAVEPYKEQARKEARAALTAAEQAREAMNTCAALTMATQRLRKKLK